MLKRERSSDWEQDAPSGRSYTVAEGDVETTLGSDTSFKGTLTFEKPLKIDGKFEGELTTKGSLIVGQSGEVHADIHVGDIVINGKVSGNIGADGKVQLNPTASLIGDIKAARLAIAEGATFVGNCDVNPAGASLRRTPGEIPPAVGEKKPAVSDVGAKVIKTVVK